MIYPNNTTRYEEFVNDPILNLDEVQAQQIQLIRDLSHELRTPLTLIYGYMQSIHRRDENLTDLLKLIDNAVKYSETAITIRLEKSGDSMTISICDHGCGINFLDQHNIFNPFYRVDRSRNRDTGGVGLGLAIAKVLVEGMGGTLNVYSQLGEGSIFKIILKSLDSIA